MGYTPQRTTYLLDFGDRYGGLEVKVRAGTLGQLLELQGLGSGEDSTPEQNRELLERFAALLVRWNITNEDDSPVPATLDGLLSLEPGLAMDIVQAGAQALGGVAPPLPDASDGGGPSAVASLPTVPLSPDPPS
jgi:hypothetical protein